VGVSVLEQEIYSEAEAARLLRVPQSTLNYWLEGGPRRGKVYEPVIREKPRGGRPPVTWSEFVEAGLLKQYRRGARVPMAELRAFITKLREELGVPYPLAHAKPFALGGRLITARAQEEAGLGAEFSLVAEVSGQMVLTGPAEAFYQRVVWENDDAMGWRPHDDPDSAVRISPDVRFGKPAVGGISTEVLWEQFDAGVDIAELADDFDLTPNDVRWAVSYETAARAA
jgi:uncharacterized protein (DUF433 family)